MNTQNSLTNIEKAAVTLMSLGTEVAAQIMTFLTETEVKRLSRAFLGLQQVNRESQAEIAAEFNRMLQAAETVFVDGREFARGVIANAFGNEQGESLLEYITGTKKEPLNVLLSDIPDAIAEAFVTSEHPQTIAFLMSKMKPEDAADLLLRMNEELQTDVLVRISQIENVKSEVVDEVREVLRNQLRGISMREEEEIGGTKATADILNFVDRNNEERILTELEEINPELADEIRNLMFTFEDIQKLDDRSIQTVLKDIPREHLLLSLKTASQQTKDLLFRNMSQRAAQMLQDDLESVGPVKLKDVEKAQQAVVDVIRRLEAEGKIQVAGGGDDVLV